MARGVLGAIKDRWESSDELAQAVPGGLWTGFVPEEVSKAVGDSSFAVLVHGGRGPHQEGRDTDNIHHLHQLQLALWSGGRSDASGAQVLDEEIIPLVEEVFEDCEALLTVQDARVVDFEITNYLISPEEVKTKDGRIVFAATLDLQLWTTRPRKRNTE